jgi:uncharacterized protein (TIGR03067 family)
MQHIIIFKKRSTRDPKEETTEKELKRFEGTWKIVALEVGGERTPERFFEDPRVTIEANGKFTYTENKVATPGTFKVDLAKKPHHIDITFTGGPDKGKTILGIYELDGDTYRVCLAIPGKRRPTEFASAKESGQVLEVFEREQP